MQVKVPRRLKRRPVEMQGRIGLVGFEIAVRTHQVCNMAIYRVFQLEPCPPLLRPLTLRGPCTDELLNNRPLLFFPTTCTTGLCLLHLFLRRPPPT